jgi:hypothetical protein
MSGGGNHSPAHRPFLHIDAVEAVDVPEAMLRARPMRTFGEVVDEAIRDEREAIRTYADSYVTAVRALEGRQRLSAAEARMLCRRIESFAEGIAQGLHVGSGRDG